MRNRRLTYLEACRRKLGWSQEDLTIESGVPQSNISQIERGIRVPTAEEFQALAKALEISPPEILLQEAEIVWHQEVAISEGGASK